MSASIRTPTVAFIALANFAPLAQGLLVGPLQAQALGTVGRGELAAVLVPLTFAATGLSLGLSQTALWLASRGERPRSIWRASVPALVLGTVGATAVSWAAPTLLAGQPAVVLGLFRLGLWAIPAGLVLQVLAGIAAGQARWSVLGLSRTTGPLVITLGTALLALLGQLTVQTEGRLVISAGVVALLVCLPFKPRLGRELHTSRREALSYGARSWAASLANIVNGRVDQLFLIPLVTSAELGLYAVAANVAGLPGPVISAIGTMLQRESGAETGGSDPATTVRRGVVLAVLLALGLAALVPATPLIFGAGFAGAEAACYLLLIGSVGGAGALLCSAQAAGLGRPGLVSVTEIATIGVTFAGLVLTVPTWGILGAALTSILAYWSNWMFLALLLARKSEARWKDFVVPRGEDVRLVSHSLLDMMRSLLRRTSRSR